MRRISFKSRAQSGDTIVEVLLATVVISIVVAGAYSLTNRATRGNQAAIERTAVANYMKEQIELIRGIRSSAYDGSWQAVLSQAVVGVPDFTLCQPTAASIPFYIDSANPAVVDLQDPNLIQSYTSGSTTDAHPSDIFMIWVEAYEQSQPEDNYVDFFVRACWQGIVEQGQMQKESLVLRLER